MCSRKWLREDNGTAESQWNSFHARDDGKIKNIKMQFLYSINFSETQYEEKRLVEMLHSNISYNLFSDDKIVGKK
jgi:hypothetical protein